MAKVNITKESGHKKGSGKHKVKIVDNGRGQNRNSRRK
jgi:hypothetical protein